MKDFKSVVAEIEQNQRNYYILTSVGVSLLLLLSLWLIDISQNLKSDRLSPTKVQSDRLLHQVPSQRN